MGLGFPEGLQTPLDLEVGAEAGYIQPHPLQDTDDKWACVLRRQRRLCWGHLSPSPGSHTAVPPGATAHLTSQPGPWTGGVSS